MTLQKILRGVTLTLSSLLCAVTTGGGALLVMTSLSRTGRY